MSADQMRAEFDAWVNRERPSLLSSVRTHNDDEQVMLHLLDAAWQAFQAGRSASRAALAQHEAQQAEQPRMCGACERDGCLPPCKFCHKPNSGPIDTAPKQAEQQAQATDPGAPVAGACDCPSLGHCDGSCAPYVGQQAQAAEPVAWRTYDRNGWYVISPTRAEAERDFPGRDHQPLYTSPLVREPLTSAEISDLWFSQPFFVTDLRTATDFVRDVERVHNITGAKP